MGQHRPARSGAATLYVVNWLLAQRLRRLPRGRERAEPGAALLVAVGGGAVLLRLADPDPRHGAARAAGTVEPRRSRSSPVWASWSPSRWATRSTRRPHNPAAAYFVTPTRMWELGIGGLLAVVVAVRAAPRPRPPAAATAPRIVLAWVGFAAIAWTAWTYTGKTPFPGWQALLPVLGHRAGDRRRTPRCTGSPPARCWPCGRSQWLGDVSYSVYLWHWPLIVLIPQVRGHDDRQPRPGRGPGAHPGARRAHQDLRRGPVPHAAVGHPAAASRSCSAPPGWSWWSPWPRCSSSRSTSRADERRGPSWPVPSPTAARASAPRRWTGPEQVRAGALRQDRAGARRRARRTSPMAYDDVSGGKDCFSYLPGFRQVTCTFGDRGQQRRRSRWSGTHTPASGCPRCERLARQAPLADHDLPRLAVRRRQTPPAVRHPGHERGLPGLGASVPPAAVAREQARPGALHQPDLGRRRRTPPSRTACQLYADGMDDGAAAPGTRPA